MREVCSNLVPTFHLRWFIFPFEFENSLYIVNVCLLSDLGFVNTFSISMTCFFILLTVSFKEKFLILINHDLIVNGLL